MHNVTAQPATSSSSSCAPLTVAELTSRLCADQPLPSSRGSRPAGSVLSVEQLLRREGRCMPVSPTPRIADPVLPHPVRRSAPPVVPPPEHRNLRAAAAVAQPQAVVSVVTNRETAADSPGMPGPARLLATQPAPPGGRRSHRRRPPARRPLVFGATVAGAAMFVGSMASSALPDTPGHAISSPTLDVPGHPGSAVGSSGAVMLGAAARDAAPTPISVVQAGLVQPSINPPVLGERARPLTPGPVIIAAPHRMEPETSSRSTMSTPPTVAPGDAPAPDAPAPDGRAPDAQTAPPAGPEESVDQPQADAPAAPADPAPADPDPAPEQDLTEQDAPEEGAPEQGVPENNGTPYSNVPGDRVADTPDATANQGDPQNGSDEGGRHRR
ncbi:MAG: hypothetical protein ACRDTE_19085 [Pseudonocardiaceae bacterium]